MSLFGTVSSGSNISARTGGSSSGGGGGPETLAQVLHNDPSIVVGQNPTGAPGLAPTTIEGERATLNLDEATVNLSVRPSVVGDRGPIGLVGVSYADGTKGEDITISAGSSATSQGGDLILSGGGGNLDIAPLTTTHGHVYINGGVNDGTDPVSRLYGNVTITAGGSTDVTGYILCQTQSATNVSGPVFLTTGTAVRTGPIYLFTGYCGADNSTSGEISLSTGQNFAEITNGTGNITISTGDVSASSFTSTPSQSGTLFLSTGSTYGVARAGHIFIYAGAAETATPGEIVFGDPFAVETGGRHLVVKQFTKPALNVSNTVATLAQYSSDISGQLTFNVGQGAVNGSVTITFRSPYASAPFITLTTLETGTLSPAKLTSITTTGFTVSNPNESSPGSGLWAALSVCYHVVGGRPHP